MVLVLISYVEKGRRRIEAVCTDASCKNGIDASGGNVSTTDRQWRSVLTWPIRFNCQLSGLASVNCWLLALLPV